MYENAQKNWTDSLFRLARENEDSKKYTEARYYYNRLYSYDSLLTEARAGIRRVDSLAAKAALPKEVKKLTPEEIEKLFQDGRAKFVANDYATAKIIFQKILALDPNHVKAKDYLRRTEARLKALGQ
jgi:tetratricopeptide (TPR) repeat protein